MSCCTWEIEEKDHLIQEFLRKLEKATNDHQRQRIQKQLDVLDDAMMIHRITCCTSNRKISYIP